MGNCRLNANTHQAIGVINWLPCVGGQLGTAAIVRIAKVANVQARASRNQKLRNLSGALVCRTMQSDAARISLKIRINTQFQQQLHCCNCLLR